MNMSKKLGAEFIGTFWLVLGGCGRELVALLVYVQRAVIRHYLSLRISLHHCHVCQ